MIKMYRIATWSHQIDEYVVVKLTDKTVWFINSQGKEEKELLKSKSVGWFNFKKDAIDWKKSILEFEVKLKQDSLNYYQKRLDDFCTSNGI